MSTKEDLVNDINIVVSMSSRYDMSIPANAERYFGYFTQKKSFKTDIGNQYLTRLQQISTSTSPSTCFACKRNRAFDRILCESCMQKYSRGQKDFYGKKETNAFSALDSVFEESNRNSFQNNNVETGNDEKAIIAQRLKPYKNLEPCTCLECGYSGLMGVVRYKNGFMKRIVIPLIICGIAGYLTGSFIGGLIVGFIVGIIVDAVFGNHKKVLFCPNCQRKIVQR